MPKLKHMKIWNRVFDAHYDLFNDKVLESALYTFSYCKDVHKVLGTYKHPAEREIKNQLIAEYFDL